MKKNPLIIGVCGGSGSGKTTFSRQLFERLGADKCAVLAQDSYYNDYKLEFDFDGGKFNFDHPSTIDFDLMTNHLRELKKGHKINVPVYDFSNHGRKDYCDQLDAKDVIIVEGILILSQENIRQELDLSIFFDIEEDLRFERRLRRDVLERGRTEEGVYKQFHSQVLPMHNLFVGPSSKFATYVIKNNVKNSEYIEKIIQEYIF